jgi:hypothetical protein
MNAVQWAQAVSAMLGALIGAVGGLFTAGWRLGRMEARLKLDFEHGRAAMEKRLESKVDDAQRAFDETLKGLRQKINDVELESERRFLLKDDFNDFREEYRQDMRDLKTIIQGNKQCEK